MSEDIAALEAAVEERAEQIDEAMAEVLPFGEDMSLYDASQYLLEAGGKRLRPAILLLVTEALGREAGDYDGVMPAAIAVEITHGFTLIHDDIMDDDRMRRGVEAVHVKWDDSTAILTGDFLYSKAFELLLQAEAPAEDRVEMLATMAETCTMICEGQAMDIAMEGGADVTEDQYLAMVEKKTAVLFAASAAIGAILGGADEETVEAMRRYGNKIGTAFQIQDDVLDLKQPSEQMGKARGSDLLEGKRTLISIHASEHGVQPFLSSDATEEEIEAKVREIEEAGSIDYARDRAMQLVAESKAELDVLPPGPARDLLEAVPDLLVERDH